MKRRGVGVAALIALFAAGQAMAVECPVAHPSASGGALKETPEMILHIEQTLAQDGAKAAPEVIAGLRARHPAASNGMIMNYLITAYCPAINKRPDLSEAQKLSDIRDFNRDVGKLLFK